MAFATIFEAKTTLSELIKKAQAGEKVVITSGRNKTPVAEIQAIAPTQPKRLGALYTPGFKLGPGFWEPLPEGWDGISGNEEDPLLQMSSIKKQHKPRARR
jgi:antitoxin (DNA-binding transcriptional repressor) of toxin-antitoxin stability system